MALQHPLERLGHLGGLGPQELGRLLQGPLLRPQVVQGGQPGEGEDAPGVGADGALLGDLQRPDRAQGVHVGPAAQLERIAAGLDHPHELAVLLAEHGDGAQLLGVVPGRLEGAHGLVGHDMPVDQPLHPVDLLLGHGPEVAEVEAEVLGADQRSLLLDVAPQDGSQGPVQHVGAGVVASGEGRHVEVTRTSRHPAPARTPASPAIAVPVVAKIPAPMMAPTPRAVRCHFPKARLRPWLSAPPSSAVISESGLQVKSWDTVPRRAWGALERWKADSLTPPPQSLDSSLGNL